MAGARIMFVFTRHRDEPFALLATAQTSNRPTFEHYATVVPVKIRGRQVETCFLSRWDVQIRRQSAVNPAVRPLARPGDTGYRRYRNLKLTLSPDDPVLLQCWGGARGREEKPSCSAPEVVIRLHATRPGCVEFSVSAGSDQIVDLTQLGVRDGLRLRAMLDRLNHGDAWDRVADL
jgi:hypothetical protein